MKLLLTSFGLSHLQRREQDNPDVFYRMPPVSMSQFSQEFLPDYSALLLADEIIVDAKSYERLLKGSHRSYGTVAILLKMLRDEGFVRLEDFDAIVESNRPLLERMLERDLKELDSWVVPLKESVSVWRGFFDELRGTLREDIVRGRTSDSTGPGHFGDAALFHEFAHHTAHWMHNMMHRVHHSTMLVELALRSSEMRRKSEYRQALRDHLAEYLSYVNANLLLCEKFQTGFHDWYDFQPFYRDKFLRVAQEAAPGQKEIASVKKLFEISFPEFTFWRPDNIVRALKDKRIRDLRQLVDDSADGKVDFDREFATRVLQEVFVIERNVARFRNIVSYITQPLGFIPFAGAVVQKAAEEAVGAAVENRRKRKFRWFYLISELAAKTSKEENGK